LGMSGPELFRTLQRIEQTDLKQTV
jgi:hypothetical protein